MSDVERLIGLYLLSFEQMRVVRWRKTPFMGIRPIWLIRLLRENNHEHCGSMMLLMELVFELAHKRNDLSITSLNKEHVRHDIWIHDGEERIVCDQRNKTADYYRRERSARAGVIKSFRALKRNDLGTRLSQYPHKSTLESRFVKVIDELQAWSYMIFIDRPNWSKSDLYKPETIKAYAMSEEFPLLREIADSLLLRMRKVT